MKDLNRDELHYVWVDALWLNHNTRNPKQDYSYTIRPMVTWVKNAGITDWECGWHDLLDLPYRAYFGFLKIEDATLFKLTWK